LLFTHDYKKRPSASDILKHKWLQQKSKRNSSLSIEIVETIETEKILSALNSYHTEQKFQQAIITYLTHNHLKNEEVKKLRESFFLSRRRF